MELTKEQTIQIHINNSKYNSFKHKFKFSTKFKWYCLSCLTPIYVSYRQYGRNSIFCSTCYPKFAIKETIVQYQYMKVLKNKQLKLIESQINKNNEI